MAFNNTLLNSKEKKELSATSEKFRIEIRKSLVEEKLNRKRLLYVEK